MPNHRILVVDDNEAIHEDFRKILGGDEAADEFDALAASVFGETTKPAVTAFELSFASQGAQALELVKAALREGRRYSVVFTDIRMPPGWDGLETTLKLWEVDPDLQIVLCTAYSDKSWKEVREKLGHPESVLILKKPFDTIEVLQLAHALTEKWALRQSARRNQEELERTVAMRTRELQTAHQGLQASERRYRMLNTSAPIGIFECDPEGRCVYVNPYWERLSGIPQTEALGMGWRKILHPEDESVVCRDWTQAVAEARGFHSEHRYLRDNGEVRWICTQSVVIRAETGEVTGHVGTVEDITEQKLAAAAMASARDAALESADLKSRFLANMSHEIRTPMNGIIGMTDLALETELSAEQRRYLEMTKTSARSLLALINDILDFSKIEAGKLDLETVDFRLRDCLGNLLKPLAMRAEQRGLELTADISVDVPDHVVGDPMRLGQVLINLIDNAIKFTERGEVMLRVFSSAESDSALHFSVEDTGIGIPPAKQALIFDAFSQADGSTTRTHGGTGLGLAIASELVRKMGGRLWVESKAGEGTTFHFTAPLAVKDPASPAASQEAAQLAGLRAMVVDNNPTNRQIVGDMLASWQMRPALIGTAAAALDELARATRNRSPFSVVIIDATMPDLDGFALVEKIRQQPGTITVPVLMLPAVLPAGAIARCAELGIASTLSKPIFQADLLAAILLAKQQPRLAPAAEPPRAAVPVAVVQRSLRILLAEDNAINRALATGILQKRGHTLVHATNGREAVEAARDASIDLIFMDVQMPEMDGLQATQMIREEQQGQDRHTPIVAMTAHAMAGDRERCVAAGMDDYLTKPLEREKLFALIERISTNPPKRPAERPEPVAKPPLNVVPAIEPVKAGTAFSRAALLARFDRNEGTLREIAALFERETPKYFNAIREGITNRRPEDIARAAHALLGTFGAIGATTAHTLTLRIEETAYLQNYTQLGAFYRALEREASEVQAMLAECAGQLHPA